jgi:NitT/TauT family transport system substrate-binding protein
MKRALLALAILLAPWCAKADLPVWRHGVLTPKSDAGIELMAARGGFGTRGGLDIQIVAIKDDPGLMRALLAGQLETIEGGPGIALLAAAHGAPVRLLGCNWPVLPLGVFVRADITRVEDLRGRNFAIAGPSGAPDLVARAMLAQHGIPRDAVRFADMGGDADRYKAVVAGVVDGTVVSMEYVPMAAKDGVHLLAAARDVLPQYMRLCISATQDTIAHRHDELVAFLAAEIAGLRHAMSDRDASLTMTREVTHMNPDDPRPAAVYDDAQANHLVDPDLGLPMDKLAWLQNQLVTIGNLTKPVDLSTVVDTGPRNDALALLKKQAEEKK